MKKTFLFIAIAICLSGCFEDRYRYTCQNPDKFNAPECQKPRCQFTQTCPEYLVAPVLEKKSEPAQPAASNASGN